MDGASTIATVETSSFSYAVAKEEMDRPHAGEAIIANALARHAGSRRSPTTTAAATTTTTAAERSSSQQSMFDDPSSLYIFVKKKGGDGDGSARRKGGGEQGDKSVSAESAGSRSRGSGSTKSGVPFSAADLGRCGGGGSVAGEYSCGGDSASDAARKPPPPPLPQLSFPAGRLYGRSDECALLESCMNRFLGRRKRRQLQHDERGGGGRGGDGGGGHGGEEDRHQQQRGDGRPSEEEEGGNGNATPATLNGDGDGDDDRPEVVLLSGHSGSGKSALAESLRGPALASGAASFFARGKFDRLRQCQPYSAFSDAFESLCREVLVCGAAGAGAGAGAADDDADDDGDDGDGDDDDDDCSGGDKMIAVRDALEREVGGSWETLALIVPSLRRLMTAAAIKKRRSLTKKQSGGGGGGSGVEVDISLKRFRNLCRAFLSAVTKHYPAVIFLDDLQWADWPSLDLLVSLATDGELSSSVLFVTTYRSNEVGADHPLTFRLESMKKRHVLLTQMEVKELTPSAINDLVADVLDMSEDKDTTRELSDAVHKITRGNVLFARQFICSLVEEGLLRKCADGNGAATTDGGSTSEQSRCTCEKAPPQSGESTQETEQRGGGKEGRGWTWDMDSISKHAIPDDVVSLLTRRMLGLSPQLVHVLKLASCLGARFELSTLRHLAKGVGIRQHFSSHLATAVEELLLEEEVQGGGGRGNRAHQGGTTKGRSLSFSSTSTSSSSSSSSSRIVRFTHDRIQQAAYELIPTNETSQWHSFVGAQLWGDASAEDLDDRRLFLVADQINRGAVGAQLEQQSDDAAENTDPDHGGRDGAPRQQVQDPRQHPPEESSSFSQS